jgi:hypothetical protein
MDWQGALRARLIAAAPVATLVWKDPETGVPAITWVDRPQANGLPAITLQTIFEERPQTMAGFDGLDRSTVQMDLWGTSYGQVQQLKEAALAAVIGENASNGIKFARAFIDAIRDLGEQTDTQFIHRASIDLIFHHATA